MKDRYPIRSVLALLLPIAALVAAGCLMGAEELRDGIFALLKLVVIR